MERSRWTRPVLILGSAAGIGMLAIQQMRGDDGSPAVPSSVVVVRASSGAPPMSPPLTTPPKATPQLAPPEPPAISDAVAAPPDAFAGRWLADGDRLTVERLGTDRYAVTLAAGTGEERYDGVLRDGRVHFAHGIDGDWLQAAASTRHCLYLGSGRRFCRA